MAAEEENSDDLAFVQVDMDKNSNWQKSAQHNENSQESLVALKEALKGGMEEQLTLDGFTHDGLDVKVHRQIVAVQPPRGGHLGFKVSASFDER